MAPTLLDLRADPTRNLPKILHKTRAGGLRPHCSSARLAMMIGCGQVAVSGVSIALDTCDRLPRQVGIESEDHRRLKTAAREHIKTLDPGAIVSVEVPADCGALKRRFDLLALTSFGTVIAYAGATDGRDLAEMLARRCVDHCLALPFSGLRGSHALGFVFSRAASPKYPSHV